MTYVFQMKSIHVWTYTVWGAHSFAEAIRTVSTNQQSRRDLDYDQSEQGGRTLDSTARLIEVREKR